MGMVPEVSSYIIHTEVSEEKFLQVAADSKFNPKLGRLNKPFSPTFNTFIQEGVFEGWLKYTYKALLRK